MLRPLSATFWQDGYPVRPENAYVSFLVSKRQREHSGAVYVRTKCSFVRYETTRVKRWIGDSWRSGKEGGKHPEQL